MKLLFKIYVKLTLQWRSNCSDVKEDLKLVSDILALYKLNIIIIIIIIFFIILYYYYNRIVLIAHLCGRVGQIHLDGIRCANGSPSAADDRPPTVPRASLCRPAGQQEHDNTFSPFK